MARRRRLIVGLLLAGMGLGCTSPEATRTRGGGPGADVGNHPRRAVQIHAGADMYYRTPTDGAVGRHTRISAFAEAGTR